MSDPYQLKIISDARLLAIEFMIIRMFASSHRELTDAQFDALNEEYWLALDAATIPGVDAVTSDALAGEVRDAVHDLLASAKTLRLPQ